MENSKITGAEAMLISLQKEGVDTIFGYPGGTIMPLYDKLFDYQQQIRHILVRHEQGAVHAAQGYSRATGKTGVCFATAGPGTTNLVTGIADAMMDSTPLVCITAQVGYDKLGSNFFQEADTISITIPLTKWSYQITSASEITTIMSKAFYIARSGRPGPVLISFTKNAQTELTRFSYTPYKPQQIKGKMLPEIPSVSISEAANMINNSLMPLIISGQGVLISGASGKCMELSKKGNIPIITTLLGISSVPTNYILHGGFAGMHGSFTANHMIQKSDLLIAIGMRFSDRFTGEIPGFAPNAKIIHIDIDKAEFDKCIKCDLKLNGDALQTLKLIMPGIKYRKREDWIKYMNKVKIEDRNMIGRKYLLKKKSGTISMAQVVNSVAEWCSRDSIIVTDVGQNQMFAASFSKFYNPRNFITSGGLGTMGFGLPAAIGAICGKKEKDVIIFTGDGGFQMSIHELGTIMKYNLPVKIVVLNNSYLGMVRQWQELFFEKRYSFTEMDNPDFSKIAQAYGILSYKIMNFNDLESKIKEMISHKGPFLLDIDVTKEENIFPMVPAGKSLDELITQ